LSFCGQDYKLAEKWILPGLKIKENCLEMLAQIADLQFAQKVEDKAGEIV